MSRNNNARSETGASSSRTSEENITVSNNTPKTPLITRNASWNSAKSQHARLLERLRLSPITTFEARRELDVTHPGGRILELREAGHDIKTVRVFEMSDCGKDHYIAKYVLVREAHQ